MKKNFKTLRVVIILMTAIMGIACSKNDKESEDYYFRAAVEDVQKEADIRLAAISSGNSATLQLYGTWDDGKEGIELYHYEFPKTTGEFVIDFPTNGNIKSIYRKDGIYFSQTKGKLVVENLTQNTIKGTFEFSATKDGKSVSVTKGEFYLPLVTISENENFPSIQYEISNIITPEKIQEIKDSGFEVYEGNTPPNIEGIYVSSPHILMRPHVGDYYRQGHRWPDARYRITAQRNGIGTLDFKSMDGSENASGNSICITGSGNKFTIYSKMGGTTNGVPIQTAVVFSGEVTNEGIKNLKSSYILTWKQGDTSDSKVMPVGQWRISGDKDGLSERIANY